ncbi:MAG: hypothetical protein ACREF0_10150 [Acetobacteraceae bacterium]
MAKQAHLTGAQNARLRLAQLGPSSPAGVQRAALSRRFGGVAGHGPLRLPPAHTSVPVPLVRPRARGR